MVVQGKDEKWMSCEGWAGAQNSSGDVSEFRTCTVRTILRYTPVQYTSIGIQYQNRCGLVDKLHPDAHTR